MVGGAFEEPIIAEASEADFGDSVSVRVAADAIPVVATVGASPRTEDSEVRLVESGFEGHE